MSDPPRRLGDFCSNVRKQHSAIYRWPRSTGGAKHLKAAKAEWNAAVQEFATAEGGFVLQFLNLTCLLTSRSSAVHNILALGSVAIANPQSPSSIAASSQQ